jgi:hypothetical protein
MIDWSLTGASRPNQQQAIVGISDVFDGPDAVLQLGEQAYRVGHRGSYH